MSASRDRKEAAKRLGLSLRSKYRALVEANGNEEVTNAAIVLGGEFNSNVEYIIWCLLEYGGVQQLPFERPKPLKQDGLPSMPSILSND